MDKLYPNKITFSNGTAPALNASNLNAMSKAIDDIDNRVIKGYAGAIETAEAIEDCQEYAEAAETSATAASTSATAASTSADAAAESATEAAGAAQAAVAEIAEELEGYKDDAETAAQEAQSYAAVAQSIADFEIISEQWDNATDYAVGDYVLYDNKLWKALAENMNIEPAEGATWTEVLVVDISKGKANKPTEESATLLATGWTGTEAPYTYDLNVSSTYDVEVLLPNTATVDEVEAITSAQIAGNGTDNLLRAWGEKPDVDVSVILRKVVR